jgi:putative cell wall-binding protein
MRRTLIVIALVAGSFVLAPEARAASFTVTNTDDSGAGSLRQAVVDANAAGGVDEITFTSDVTGAITLASQIAVTDDLTITGPGADVLTVSGNDASRIFNVSGADLSVSGLDLANGAAGVGQLGGAINVLNGDLTLIDVVVRDSTAGLAGGAICLQSGLLTIASSALFGNEALSVGGGAAVVGDADITDSTFTDNEAGSDGGGLFSLAGDVAITGSTFADNVSGNGGGGAYLDGEATVTRSAFTGNHAGLFGGGLYALTNTEPVSVIETTASGNHADVEGGGLELISLAGEVLIESTTVAENTAASVGGIGARGSSVTLRHSTVVGNVATADYGGFAVNAPNTIDHSVIANNEAAGLGPDVLALAPFTASATWSLVEDTTDSAVTEAGDNIVGVDPALGDLDDNGGPTETMFPEDGSPLIDAGDPDIIGEPTTDQRGEPRVQDRIDIGAVERTLASEDDDDDHLMPDVDVFTDLGLDDDADIDVEVFSTSMLDDEDDGATVLRHGFSIEGGDDDLDHADICVPYDPEELDDLNIGELDLELFHLPDAGGREVITTVHDEEGNQVCGRTTAFSSFVVGALQTRRLSGAGVIGTAAAVSAAAFDPGVPVAYIASGEELADAVPAAAAAAALGGPLLLTTRDVLSTATSTELLRLQPRRVVIVGGIEAVSDATLDAVEALAIPVERVAGDDRYETAAAVSAGAFGPDLPVVHVVSGDAPTDGLVAGVAAATGAGPVLYADADVPAATRGELARLSPGTVVVVGGSAAVSDDVVSALGATRLAGDDRYETSASLARASGADRVEVVVAGGEHPGYGLAAVPAAVARGAAFVLVHPDFVPSSVVGVLDRIEPPRITVVGGGTAVSRQTESDLAMHLSVR